MKTTSCGLSLALMIFGVSFPVTAGAVELLYEAGEKCPTQTEFEEEVRARGARLEAEGGILEVRLSQREGGYEGSFAFADRPSDKDRRVEGETCAEVAEALVVAIAIALEDSAEENGAAENRAAENRAAENRAAENRAAENRAAENRAQTDNVREDGSPSAAAPDKRLQSAAESAPMSEPSGVAPPPKPEWVAEWREKRMEVTDGTLTLRSESSLTLSAGVMVGWIPEKLLPRYDLTIHGVGLLTPPGGDETVVNITRLRLSLLGPGTTDATPATAADPEGGSVTDITGAAFALGMCLSPLYQKTGWSVLFCVEYGGGAARFSTRGASSVRRNSDSGFGLVGLSAEAEYRLGPFHLSGRLGAEAYVGEMTAEDPSGRRVFETGTLAMTGSFGIGVHF